MPKIIGGVPHFGTELRLYDGLLNTLSTEDPQRKYVLNRAAHFAIHETLAHRDSRLLNRIIKEHAGAEINDATINLGEYSILQGSGPFPYLQFDDSEVIFGLTPDGFPDYEIEAETGILPIAAV